MSEENPPAPAEDKKEEEAPPAEEKKEEPKEEEKADESSPLVPMPKVEVPDFSPADEGDDFRSWASDENQPVLQQCCCCICNCGTQKTDGLTCCCVIPIKAGLTVIGVLTIVLAAVTISNQFFLMLNDQVTWWYPVVNLALLIPTYIGASFFIVWFGKDSVSNRGRLPCGAILVIISASLVAAWAVIYFVWIYKRDTVFYGWGTSEQGYIKYQKKYYIFRELAWCVIVVTAYAYFICVTGSYKDALRVERSADDKKAYKSRQEMEAKAQLALDDRIDGKTAAQNAGKK